MFSCSGSRAGRPARGLMAALALCALALGLSGCTTVDAEPDEAQFAGVPAARIALRIGVYPKDAARFVRRVPDAQAPLGAGPCALVADTVLSAWTAELRSVFTDVVAVRSPEECPECALFSQFDATVVFGSVSGYSASVTSDFLAADGKKRLATLTADASAAFDQTNAGSIGMTLLNGATLGVLAPVAAPLSEQVRCSMMQSRASGIFAGLVRELVAKTRRSPEISARAEAAAAEKAAAEKAAQEKAAQEKAAAEKVEAEKAAAEKAAAEKAAAEKAAAEKAAAGAAQAASAVTPPAGDDFARTYENLLKLKDLLDKGILSVEEFEAQKAKLLGR